jgi:predicted nucleic acid-binding protein
MFKVNEERNAIVCVIGCDKCPRSQNANPEHIRVLCDRWKADLGRFSVRLHDQASLMEAAWNMALRFQHPVYDCVYLALAEEQGVPLVTADDVFVTKVGAFFPRAHLLPGMAKS